MPADKPPRQGAAPAAGGVVAAVCAPRGDPAWSVSAGARVLDSRERLQQQLHPASELAGSAGYNVPLFAWSHNTDWRESPQLVLPVKLLLMARAGGGTLADFDATPQRHRPGAYRSACSGNVVCWGRSCICRQKPPAFPALALAASRRLAAPDHHGLDLEEEQWQSLVSLPP